MSPFRYRVLMVDDDEVVCKVGAAVLQSQGYEVLCANDGFTGLAALKQSLPDVVISDLQMPKMGGFEFLSVVRKRFPQIPVIAISGEFTSHDVPESILADAFFQKGQYAPPELFEKIASLLEGPIRARPEKPSKAAVWIPSATGDNYIAVTCTDCLRTFPVSLPLAPGTHTVACDFCFSEVMFQI
ncbi:response regulator [Acidicapsa dinghuensis]|uniref:Response regulator n=1 Tax=Acidicapsa dinghuensis TaxID=2218256 RepID=A0ABW1EET3_9BACT|nr:response regulator [Acidicapsa dinghuensis]